MHVLCVARARAHYREFGGFGEVHNLVRDGGQQSPEEMAPLLYTALQQPVERWQPPPPPGATKVVSRIIVLIRAKKAKMQKALGEGGVGLTDPSGCSAV